ncbi:DUF4158 domain-containing protein [Streptomyces sp. NPDC001982]|uniref:DUF4158 domain-containing protein n=1 Tax=Streptomyces sp. NPDC001982 TaxID=3154405 RepID=UPI00332655DF
MTHGAKLRQAAVDYVADVVKVPAEALAKYGLSSRSAKGHRTQIREALGFRPETRADEQRLTEWLSTEVCPVELRLVSELGPQDR